MELRKVWNNCAGVAKPGCHLIIRFGAINDRKLDARDLLRNSLVDKMPPGPSSHSVIFGILTPSTEAIMAPASCATDFTKIGAGKIGVEIVAGHGPIPVRRDGRANEAVGFVIFICGAAAIDFSREMVSGFSGAILNNACDARI